MHVLHITHVLSNTDACTAYNACAAQQKGLYPDNYMYCQTNQRMHVLLSMCCYKCSVREGGGILLLLYFFIYVYSVLACPVKMLIFKLILLLYMDSHGMCDESLALRGQDQN